MKTTKRKSMIDDCDLPTKDPRKALSNLINGVCSGPPETPAQLIERLRSEGVDVDSFLKKIDGLFKPQKPTVVCLVGSSRFVEECAVKAWEFEKQGIMALSMNLLPRWYSRTEHHLAEAEGVAEILDELHLRKIDMADFVFVMNVAGYVGDRTKAEIEYARKCGKPVHYLLPS